MLVFDREFEDTKGVIRIRKSKKDTQHIGQKNDQQSTKHTHKTKYPAARTPLPPFFFYNIRDLHLYCLIKRNINYEKTPDNSYSVQNTDIFNIYFSKFTESLLMIHTSIVITIDLWFIRSLRL